MNRNSLMEMSGRAMHMVGRFTLNAGNSSPMMQELAMDLMNSDGRGAVEHVQSYGFSATPLPRDEQKQGQGGAAGAVASAIGEALKGAAAEGICLFAGGQRNHPICIGVDDRRHRPMGLKPGESGQYDDIGQMTLLRRTFTAILSLDSADAAGKMVERFVSLRHVVKPKQERPGNGGAGSGTSGSGSQAGTQAAPPPPPKPEDYKHEGESVNTEVRCTKNRIEFRAGEKVVGYYDVPSDSWYFTGKIITNEATQQIKDKAPRIDHN